MQLGKSINHTIHSSIIKYVSDQIGSVIHNSSFNSTLIDSVSVETTGIIWDSIRISMYKSIDASTLKSTKEKI
jgi:hypothetical protein